MSRVTDMARAEADRVEAELGDDGETTEPGEQVEPDEDTTGEPEGDEQDALERGDDAADEVEARAAASVAPLDPKKLEAALRRHEKAMRAAMGDAFADAVICGTCEGVGYTPGEVVEALPMLGGDIYATCPSCNGYGQHLTGAHPDASPLAICPNCQGGGYITKPLEIPPTPQPVAGPNGDAYAQPFPASPPVDPATVAALRAAGYVVVDPYAPAA